MFDPSTDKITHLKGAETVTINATCTLTLSDATIGTVENCARIVSDGDVSTELVNEPCVAISVSPGATPTPPVVDQLPNTGSGSTPALVIVTGVISTMLLVAEGAIMIGNGRIGRS